MIKSQREEDGWKTPSRGDERWGQGGRTGRKDSLTQWVSTGVHSNDDQDITTQGGTKPFRVKTQEHR